MIEVNMKCPCGVILHATISESIDVSLAKQWMLIHYKHTETGHKAQAPRYDAYRDGVMHVATHGETVKQAREAATAGNNLKGALGWPLDKCHDNPLPRVHENCHYYEKDWGIHCFNGWSGDGTSGHCHLEPKKVWMKGEETACMYFEPKN